jgi:indole-3-glycerol phosphate synthase
VSIPDILRKICERTRADLAARRERRPRAEVEREAAAAEPARPFAAALAAGPNVAVIAEVKKASPSAGLIREAFDPAEIARAYEEGGAAAISVLTDEPFFQGSLEYLRVVRRAVGLPVLRKDFILEPYQVWEARAAGADAVLLIVAALEDTALAGLLGLTGELGMDALVEVHDRAELERAAAAGAAVVGVNNRDLRTFEVRLETTCELAPLVPSGRVLVAESGIATAGDVARVGACGAHAVLVGEALMRAGDIAGALRALAGVPRG